jgi:UDP-N-acetylmuramyl pentapeptide phosphotransferase/UDP-N-acetylglucosamine-1-phosphate transferase
VYKAVPVVVRVSKAKNLFSSSPGQQNQVPNLGGISLFIGITISSLISLSDLPFPDLRYILIAMITLFFTGLKDDILVLSPPKKFIAQIATALILIVLGNIRISNLHGIFGLYEIDYIFSVIFSLLIIVAITNAMNLIDGIDGLAAGLGIMIAGIYGSSFLNSDHIRYAIVCFAIAGSLSAFFIYNVFGKTNKIFMGDTGSLVLGILVAILTIKYNEFALKSPGLSLKTSPAISLAVIAIPLFDMLRVFGSRLLQRKSPFSPDMGHIHHKLLKLGYSHLKSTLLLVTANLTLIGIIWLFRETNLHTQLVFLISVFILLSLLPGFIYEYKKSHHSLAKRIEISFPPFIKYRSPQNYESGTQGNYNLDTNSHPTKTMQEQLEEN